MGDVLGIKVCKKMKFDYHDLYDHQFEEVVVTLCRKLLGQGAKSFAKGPDGGRDSRFSGIAEQFPSKASPLNGNIVIQAKHTDDPIAKFSDKSFSSDAKTSVVSMEIEKLKRLVNRGQANHYMLFSNRKLTPDSEEVIVERIVRESGVESAHVIGVEDMDCYIRDFPEVRDSHVINPVDSPLRASSDDIARVVVAINRHKNKIGDGVREKCTPSQRTKFERKNEINGLSEDYAEVIIKRYLPDFYLVKDFLENPVNEDVYDKYQDAVDEFNIKIAEHRKDYHSFDSLLNYLHDNLLKVDRELSTNKRLFKLVLYYMYWSCDLGKDEDA
ncbi:MAG: restriction endonuclease [Alphaproteobacteria bacterium]|nr:restriction endonuclease [Alphaproteobacteria bacterium]